MVRLGNVLKHLCKTFSRRLGKTSWRWLQHLGDVLNLSWRRFCKTSWSFLEDVLKTYGQDEYICLDQGIIKTSSEDVWLRRIFFFWSKRLEHASRRRRRKTSSRRLHQDECLYLRKTSSRRLHQDKCLYLRRYRLTKKVQ